MQVRIVAADLDGARARAVEAELRRAGHRVAFADTELDDADGVLVLLDDEALPRALARLIHLLPGRATFPNVILVVDEPGKAGGLLGEGFRDVVSPADVARAVEALGGALPPVLLVRLREEIDGDFLPKFIAEMRQRAKEKQNLLRECVELVRAASFLGRRIHKLRRRLDRQSIDELLVLDGQVGQYLQAVDEDKRPQLTRLPQFPVGRAGGVLSKREPSYRRARVEIADTLSWLRRDGLLGALDKAGQDALDETAAELRARPLQGLRECLNIVEREIALRLSLIDRIQTQVNAVAVLEERCLERHGFGILPPGIAVPESVQLILSTLAQPPAEIYVTWCLDLRDLRLKRCADVLGDIARDLAWARAPRKRPLLPLGAATGQAGEITNVENVDK
jgi:hypothetical protein